MRISPISIALLLFAPVVWCLALPGPSRGCDTPVYRFAMYSQRWDPWPYPVFYLYDGAPGPDDEAVNARLEELARNDSLTNLAFHPVDASDKEVYKQLPPPVREQWENRKDTSGPLHLVFTPRQAPLFSGRLQMEDLQGLIDSPLRRQTATALGTGTLVFLLLEGPDEKANEEAAKQVEEVARRARDGEIKPPAGPARALLPGPGTGAEPSGDDSLAVNIKLIRIPRDNAEEAWLVKMLMHVEPDLNEFADQPMVFGVYGRGRALEPYIGQGITADNLVNLGVEFMCGPCSCEVKDQNPGVDLLTTTDWEKQALTMARIFGEEEGNERLLDVGALVPSLVSDPEEGAADRAEETGGTEGTKPPTSPVAEAGDDAPPPAEATPTAAEPSPPVSPAREAFGGRLALMLGIGVGAVLLVLVGASFLVLRGR